MMTLHVVESVKRLLISRGWVYGQTGGLADQPTVGHASMCVLTPFDDGSFCQSTGLSVNQSLRAFSSLHGVYQRAFGVYTHKHEQLNTGSTFYLRWVQV